MVNPDRLCRVSALVLLALALVTLSACSSRSDESPSLVWCWAVEPPLGGQSVVLEGLALDGGGHPLGAARVTLRACSGSASPVTGTSDAAGRFRLDIPLAEATGCLEAASGGESSLVLREIPLARPASIHALLIFKPSKAPPVALFVDDRNQPPAQP